MSTTNGSNKPLLVFVHGMYGANLVDKASEKHLWISPRTVLEALFWKNDHAVKSPLSWSADGRQQDRDSIQADSVMTLTCEPWWNFTKILEANDQAQVLNYVWDWRRSLEETCEHFLQWIHEQGLSPDRRAMLVTYSTGSLIGWTAINQYPELFSKWISVGGAVGGGNFMLQDFANGWKLGPVQLLQAETSFSMPSLYSFFPVPGEPGFLNMFTDEQTKQGVAVDTLDPKVWRERELGIYAVAKRQDRSVTEQEEIHLRNCLDAARRFRSKYFYREGATSFNDERFLFHSKEKYSHLDIFCYGSRSFETTHKGWWYNEKATNETQMKATQGVGDGTVMEWAWNMVPGGLPFRTVLTEVIHIQLLSDEKFVSFMADLLGIEYKVQKGSRALLVGLFVGLLLFLLALVGAVLFGPRQIAPALLRH